jgi:hypothetical protein
MEHMGYGAMDLPILKCSSNQFSIRRSSSPRGRFSMPYRLVASGIPTVDVIPKHQKSEQKIKKACANLDIENTW